MYKILPSYLAPIADNVQEKKIEVEFNLKCTCGCNTFTLFKRKRTEEEILTKKNFDELWKKYKGGYYRDKDRNLYLTTRGFFGIGKKKILITDSMRPIDLDIIKAKCNNCNKEYTIFNNTINGYDGFIDNKSLDGQNYEFTLINKSNNTGNVKLKIYNDVPYEEALEEFESLTQEQYTNTFTNIIIYVVKDGKSRSVYDRETA